MILTDRNSCTDRSKLRDGFLTIPRAGKRIPTGDTAKTCLQEIPRPPTPPVVKKYHNSNRPGPGVTRVHYGKVNDPDIEKTLVHGVSTKGSHSSGSSINPPRKTFYQQKFHEISEAMYASRQRARLGRSHDQSNGLPSWYNDKTTFGVKTISDIYAGELINPPKTAAQVETEAQKGHQAYIRTHNAYFVGERVDRNYNWSVYGKDRFGVSTPHFNEGSNVARSLRWLYDMQEDNNEMSVSKPFDEKLNVPADHIFGILVRSDDLGAGELIHSDDPGLYQKGRDQQCSLVNTVRHQLKKVNFHCFPSLLQAFRHYDKKGKGGINKEDMREVCRQFKLDLGESVLDDLMDYCDVDKDGLINFLEFANFLNWKDKTPISTREQQLLTKHRIGTCPANIQRKPALVEPIQSGGSQPEIQPGESQVLIKPEDMVPVGPGSSLKTPRMLRRPRTAPDRFVTSSSLIRAVVGGPPPTDSRTYGIPTVRTDLPPPRIRRISDTNNYGGGNTASSLLCPPIPSLWGVHQEHYFSPRTKKEIADIFWNVGLHLSEETFEQAWKLASMRSPTGEVCVEIFRDILKEIKAM